MNLKNFNPDIMPKLRVYIMTKIITFPYAELSGTLARPKASHAFVNNALAGGTKGGNRKQKCTVTTLTRMMLLTRDQDKDRIWLFICERLVVKVTKGLELI